MRKPKISVVIAVKNDRYHIEECIKALINQEYTKEDYEILIIDGMSTDGTSEILEKIKKRENVNLKILRNPKGDAASGRNIGIKEGKGEVVAFTDSDAIVYPDWLKNIEKYMRRFEKERKIAGVGGPDLLPENQPYKSYVISKIMASSFASGGELNPSTQHIMASDEMVVKHIPTCNLSVKREVFESEGGFDEAFIKGQDLEFSTRLSIKGYSFFYTPEIKVRHYRRRHIRDLAKQIYKWGKAKAAIIKKHGLTNPVYLLPVFEICFFLFLFLISFLLGKFLFFAIVFFLAGITYTSVILFESARISVENHDPRLFFYGLILFPIIHISYTFGICYGLIRKKIW